MKRITLTTLSLVLTLCMSAQTQLLPSLTYSSRPARVSGKLINMGADQKPQSVNIVSNPSWSTDELAQAAAVGADGTFTADLDVCVNSRAAIIIGGQMRREFIIVPGGEVKLSIDMQTKQITCDGPLAALNNSMTNYYDEYNERKLNAEINGQGIAKLRGMTVTEYGNKLMQLYNDGVKRLNDDQRLSPEFREYMIPHYQLVTVALMTGFDKLLKYANQGQGEYTQPAGYFDRVKDWNFTSKNGFLYSNGGTAADYARQLSASTGGKFTVPASLSALTAAKKYVAKLEQLSPLTAADFAAVKTECPVFEKMLTNLNAATKARVEDNERNHLFSHHQLSAELKGDDIFKAIVAPFRGKMVLVDFWATWCGPCRAAMETIKPVKEELWGKVAFVYVTGETSPQALWNKMAPDIHGDHYYVTAAQWDTLLKQFGVQGIPAYVVVDKAGNVVTKHIGYPGNDVIREEMNK